MSTPTDASVQPEFPVVRVEQSGDPEDCAALEAQLNVLLDASKPKVEEHPKVGNDVAEGFAHSTSAKAGIINILLYSRIAVTAEEFNRRAEGNVGGVGGVGAVGTWGKLFYDNADDLSGTCIIQVTSAALALNINFLTRSGKLFASFFGGGIGTTGGVWVGTADWVSI